LSEFELFEESVTVEKGEGQLETRIKNTSRREDQKKKMRRRREDQK